MVRRSNCASYGKLISQQFVMGEQVQLSHTAIQKRVLLCPDEMVSRSFLCDSVAGAIPLIKAIFSYRDL